MYQQSLSRLDHSSIATLYQSYASPMLRYIRRHVARWEDAEDLVLELFLAALEHEEMLTRLDTDRQQAWLRRVAHNKIVDFYRRSAIRSAAPLSEAVTETLLDDENETPERVVLRREEYNTLHTLLESLPNRQQEVLRLRFAAGLRCSEIARMLNTREGTIRSLLSRSLNFLRTIYEK